MMTMPNWVRRWVVRPGVTILALAAVGAIVEAVLEHRERQVAPVPGRLVDVGGGRRLYLNCTGSGSPVVVLAAGLGGGAESWQWIAPEVAKETRVCTFDRAGRGWSDDVAAPQDANAVAQDLAAALTSAGEVGPYVLAGHSFGGLYVRAFAAQYPDRTAGMVLLDASDPQMFTRLPAYPGFYKWFRRATTIFPALSRVGVGRLIGINNARQARSLRDEFAMAPVSMEQAGALVTLGDKPLLVLTALKGAQEGWGGLQDELPQLSTNHKHWIETTAAHQDLVDVGMYAEVSSRGIEVVVGKVRGTEWDGALLRFAQDRSSPAAFVGSTF